MPERTPTNPTNSRSDGRIRPSANPDQSTSLSRQQSLANTRAAIKSLIFKNLVASSMFPRLYADVMIAYAPKSHEAKILAQNYKKILQRTNTERTNHLMSNVKSCTHIKVTGVRCGCPPLRGEQFCYFHQRMLRTVRYPASRVHHTALLEDEESIQASLMEVVNALLRGTIELKRAELILRALNTAVRNIRRVKFGMHSDEMVREIPDYPTPPSEPADQPAPAPRRPPTHEEVARQRAASLAEYFGGPDKIPAHLKPTIPATTTTPGPITPTHVGTAAPGCPGGPEVPGRSAPPPKPVQAEAATTRKPPVSVNEVPVAKTQAATARAAAPKERKNAGHRASGG